MAVSATERLDKIVLPSSTEISVINSARIDAGITNQTMRPAGHAHPMFTSNQSQTPKVEFTTPQLDVVLGYMTLAGVAMGTTDLYLKAASNPGNVARATTGHKKLRMTAGVGYWSQINLKHNAPSDITGVLEPIYDGTNDPIVYAGSQALSGNLAVGTFFGAGPVAINGTALGAVQSISVASGIQTTKLGGESEEFPTFAGIEMTEPVITIQFQREYNWSSIGLRGTTLDGTNGLVFYARKFSNGASRVANATAEHIKFTVLNGLANPVDSSGQNSSPISDTIRIHARSASDSVLPMTVNTASAIT